MSVTLYSVHKATGHRESITYWDEQELVARLRELNWSFGQISWLQDARHYSGADYDFYLNTVPPRIQLAEDDGGREVRVTAPDLSYLTNAEDKIMAHGWGVKL